MLASEIFTEAAALLNDPNKGTFTDAIMLPMLKRAYDSLQSEFALLGANLLSEDIVPADIAAGALTVTNPSDMLFPIEISERANGETDPSAWDPMDEVKYLPDRSQGSSLLEWSWRKDAIQFVGSTEIREIRIRYRKSFPTIASGATTLAIGNAKGYLSAKTAALCAMFIGENPDRAGICETEAERELKKLTRTVTKKMQGAGAVSKIDVYSQIY